MVFFQLFGKGGKGRPLESSSTSDEKRAAILCAASSWTANGSMEDPSMRATHRWV